MKTFFCFLVLSLSLLTLTACAPETSGPEYSCQTSLSYRACVNTADRRKLVVFEIKDSTHRQDSGISIVTNHPVNEFHYMGRSLFNVTTKGEFEMGRVPETSGDVNLKVIRNLGADFKPLASCDGRGYCRHIVTAGGRVITTGQTVPLRIHPDRLENFPVDVKSAWISSEWEEDSLGNRVKITVQTANGFYSWKVNVAN